MYFKAMIHTYIHTYIHTTTTTTRCMGASANQTLHPVFEVQPDLFWGIGSKVVGKAR